MRTFHTGGIFSSETGEIIQSPTEGIIKYDINKKGKKILTKYQEKAFLTLEEKEIMIKKNNIKTIKLKVPPYTIILMKSGKKVYEKQIIGECGLLKENKKIKEIKEIKSNLSGIMFIKKKNINLLWILSSNIIIYELLINIINIISKIQKPISKKRKNISYIKNIQSKTKVNHVFLDINRINVRNFISHKRNENLIENKTKKEILTRKVKTHKTLSIKNNKIKVGNMKSEGEKITKFLVTKFSIQIIEKRKNMVSIRKSMAYKVPKNMKTKNINTIKKGNMIYRLKYSRQKNEDIVQGHKGHM